MYGNIDFEPTYRDDFKGNLFLIWSDSSLFDRDTLVALLDPGFSEYEADEVLILAAYRKWGAECPSFLSGEFSFVVWDPDNLSLFCCRDPIASRPLFYTRLRTRFVFASDPEDILLTAGVSRYPNLRKIATLAVPGGVSELPDETLYGGIFALLAGTRMTVTRSGIRVERYWTPKVRESLVPESEEEAFHALRSLLIKSVEDRIERVNATGALLSGGLDSSAILAIAGRFAEMRNRTVTAIAAVQPENGSSGFTDEREFIGQFSLWPAVRINYVTPPDDAGPFDAIENPDQFRRSSLVSPQKYIFDAFQGVAVSRGVDVILDGCGGEHGPTTHSRVYYLELLLSGKWWTLRRELALLKSREGCSPLRELAGHILNALFPLRRAKPYLLLNPGFVREHAAEVPPVWMWPEHRRIQAAGIRKYLDGRSAHTWDGPVRYSFPLLDPRLLEFCLAAPGSMKVADGYYRVLIRKSLDGILPPRIQWRTDKMPFAPDYFVRYNRQLEVAKNWLKQFGPRDPLNEIVDLKGLQARMTLHIPNSPGFGAATLVPTTIYLINFLRQFSDFRA